MYSEIEDIIPNATVTFDKVAAVKIAVWNSNRESKQTNNPAYKWR